MSEPFRMPPSSGSKAHGEPISGLPSEIDWQFFDRIVDTVDEELLRLHGIGPLAAYNLRTRGREIPSELVREERAAGAANLVAPILLARAREAYDGPLVLLKGPEVARRYPGCARRFSDLDLLPEDAEEAQAALLAAGFRLHDTEWPPPGYDGRHESHHLQPLEWPGLALRIEIHRRVNWLKGLIGPPNREIIDAAVTGSHGIDGVLVPDPHHQAVLLAAHVWSVRAMRQLRELMDVAVYSDGLDRSELEALARRWQFAQGWRTTTAVLDWLMVEGAEPSAIKVWARYLRDLREPTVLEMHLQEYLAPWWMVPPRRALQCVLAAIAHDFSPQPGQTPSVKLRQIARAASHALSSKSDHVRRSADQKRRG